MRAGKRYRDTRRRDRGAKHREYFQLRPRLTAFEGMELPAVWQRTGEELQIHIKTHERKIEEARAEGDLFAERDHTEKLGECRERAEICTLLCKGVELSQAVELVMNGAQVARVTEAAAQGAVEALRRNADADERRRRPQGKVTEVYGSQSGPERDALGDLTAERITVEVDPARLEASGDVRESYSGDKIPDGRVRRPFQFGREMYVSVGGGNGYENAMRLVPRTAYKGETFTYSERADGNGYEGIRVTWRNVEYVLTHPRLTLKPRDPSRTRLTAPDEIAAELMPTDCALHVAAVSSFTHPDELFKYQRLFNLPLIVENFSPDDPRFSDNERALICAAVKAKQTELEARYAFGFWKVDDIAHPAYERIGRTVKIERRHKVEFHTLACDDGTQWIVRNGALRYVTREEVLAVWPTAFDTETPAVDGDGAADEDEDDGGTQAYAGSFFRVTEEGPKQWRGKSGQCTERDGARVTLFFLTEGGEHTFNYKVLERAPDLPKVETMLAEIEGAADAPALEELRARYLLNHESQPWVYSPAVWRDLLLAVERRQAHFTYLETMAQSLQTGTYEVVFTAPATHAGKGGIIHAADGRATGAGWARREEEQSGLFVWPSNLQWRVVRKQIPLDAPFVNTILAALDEVTTAEQLAQVVETYNLDDYLQFESPAVSRISTYRYFAKKRIAEATPAPDQLGLPAAAGSETAAAPGETPERCPLCGYKTGSHSLVCRNYSDPPPTAPPPVPPDPRPLPVPAPTPAPTPPPPALEEGAAAVAVVTLEEVQRYFSETILLPETNAEMHKAMFRRVVASQLQLAAELNKFRKDKIERIGGYMSREERKAELIERVVWDLIEDFTFGKLRSGGVSMRYFNDQAYRLELNTKTVEAMTDDDLDRHREHVAESRAKYDAAKAETERAVTNPQTLEDFETCIRHRGIAALRRDKATIPKGRGKSAEIEAMIRRAGEKELNQAELALYDELRAGKAQERRAGLMIEKANIKRIEIGEGNYMEIVKSHHDKRGCDIWVVVLAEREDRTTFEELCIAARKLDGNYQREWKPTNTPGGFRFFSAEQAEKFVQLQSRDVFEISRLEKLLANRERVRQNAIGHFGGLADRMEDRATDALTQPRRMNTERRIMQAERADDQAREQLAMADTLRNYARDLQARLTRHTDRIRWRTHAEALNDILARASGDLSKVTYPWPSVSKHTLMEIAREIGDRDGSKLVSSRILKLCREQLQDEILFIGDARADLLRHFYRRARLHRTSRWTLDRIREALGHFKRLRLMNLDSLPELRAALREHLGRRVEVAEMSRAERVMRDLYQGQFPPDYFPTPPDVVELMLEHAAIEDGMTILEPEAGGAHIANIVRDRYPNSSLTLIEIAGLLVKALQKQGYDPIHADFLSLAVPEAGFDRVIANPPFGCDGLGTDIEHVRRMYEWCKWGGRITTLMSDGVFYRGDGRAQEFRAWLEYVGGESFELPEGAFLNGDRPTSWAARIVVIDKIEQPGDGADVSTFIPAAAPPALLSTSLN